MEIEHFFTCPYCWQRISVVLDLSEGGQVYIEDCETCCNPIKIGYTTGDSGLESFAADSIEQ